MHQFAISGLLIVFSALCSAPASGQARRTSNNFAALSARANAARDADRLDEALPLYKKALALRPTWAEGWWSLGTIQYDRNAYAEAAVAFRKLLALKPRDGTAHAMLSLCEFELGHDAAAFRHIEESRKLGLSANEQLQHVVLYHEAVLLQRRGKFEQAQEDLQQLCLQGVNSDDIANMLGLVLLRRTDLHLPSPDTADHEILLDVGRAGCLSGQRKYEESRQFLAPVVKKHLDYPNLHYAYGMLLLDANDQPGAVAEFKKEIENNPKHVYARLRIAAALYKSDSLAGIPFAQQAVDLAPNVPLGHYLLGLLFVDTDAHEKAIPELEIASKSFSRDAKLYFALGSAYARVGRMQDAARARAIFEKLQKETHSKSPTAQPRATTPSYPD